MGVQYLVVRLVHLFAPERVVSEGVVPDLSRAVVVGMDKKV